MPREDEEKKLLNPTTLAGARRLLQNPDALDKAIEKGLSTPRPEPTYDDTRKRRHD